MRLGTQLAPIPGILPAAVKFHVLEVGRLVSGDHREPTSSLRQLANQNQRAQFTSVFSGNFYNPTTANMPNVIAGNAQVSV